MRTSDFDYHLPRHLIAQIPLEPRDSSRLLVLHQNTGLIEHRHFFDIVEYLRPGDVIVLNESRVLPARLRGHREDTGGKVELLLLTQQGPDTWHALARPGKRLRPGIRIVLAPQGKTASYAEILATHEDGIKTVRLEPNIDIGLIGEMPLPPYIHQRLEDPERYQTVYARHQGSAAAPTAGLHFTHQLMERVKDAGVELALVTLHVGLDTFRPVQGEDPSEHKIHNEYFELSAKAAETLNRARADSRRIIAVGTTSVRALEQAARHMLESGRDQLTPTTGQANLFILPGHEFQVVGALVTNFHLPRSTLLMLVSAFAGREASAGSGLGLVLKVYQEAIEHQYRFYSFGDAMLLL